MFNTYKTMFKESTQGYRAPMTQGYWVRREVTSDFSHLHNHELNRCFSSNPGEAKKYGFSEHQAEEFRRRRDKVKESIRKDGVSSTASIKACEYDGRYFITDGQARREAIDILNSELQEGEPKYAIAVDYYHVNSAQDVLKEIFAANQFHTPWRTDDKMRTAIEFDGNESVKDAYSVIASKQRNLIDAFPQRTISMSILYEIVFGSSTANRWEKIQNCHFGHKSYWKQSLRFIDDVLVPFMETLKKNMGGVTGITKKHVNTMTQLKFIRNYTKLFKNFTPWLNANYPKASEEEMWNSLKTVFINWAETITPARLDKINTKSAPVALNAILIQMNEIVGSMSKDSKILRAYFAHCVKNND